MHMCNVVHTGAVHAVDWSTASHPLSIAPSVCFFTPVRCAACAACSCSVLASVPAAHSCSWAPLLHSVGAADCACSAIIALRPTLPSVIAPGNFTVDTCIAAASSCCGEDEVLCHLIGPSAAAAALDAVPLQPLTSTPGGEFFSGKRAGAGFSRHLLPRPSPVRSVQILVVPPAAHTGPATPSGAAPSGSDHQADHSAEGESAEEALPLAAWCRGI